MLQPSHDSDPGDRLFHHPRGAEPVRSAVPAPAGQSGRDLRGAVDSHPPAVRGRRGGRPAVVTRPARSCTREGRRVMALAGGATTRHPLAGCPMAAEIPGGHGEEDPGGCRFPLGGHCWQGPVLAILACDHGWPGRGTPPGENGRNPSRHPEAGQGDQLMSTRTPGSTPPRPPPWQQRAATASPCDHLASPARCAPARCARAFSYS